MFVFWIISQLHEAGNWSWSPPEPLLEKWKFMPQNTFWFLKISSLDNIYISDKMQQVELNKQFLPASRLQFKLLKQFMIL